MQDTLTISAKVEVEAAERISALGVATFLSGYVAATQAECEAGRCGMVDPFEFLPVRDQELANEYSLKLQAFQATFLLSKLDKVQPEHLKEAFGALWKHDIPTSCFSKLGFSAELIAEMEKERNKAK